MRGTIIKSYQGTLWLGHKVHGHVEVGRSVSMTFVLLLSTERQKDWFSRLSIPYMATRLKIKTHTFIKQSKTKIDRGLVHCFRLIAFLKAQKKTLRHYRHICVKEDHNSRQSYIATDL